MAAARPHSSAVLSPVKLSNVSSHEIGGVLLETRHQIGRTWPVTASRQSGPAWTEVRMASVGPIVVMQQHTCKTGPRCRARSKRMFRMPSSIMPHRIGQAGTPSRRRWGCGSKERSSPRGMEYLRSNARPADSAATHGDGAHSGSSRISRGPNSLHLSEVRRRDVRLGTARKPQHSDATRHRPGTRGSPERLATRQRARPTNSLTGSAPRSCGKVRSPMPRSLGVRVSSRSVSGA